MEISVSWYQVDDFEAAKKFYSQVLGLNKTYEMEGWAEFGPAEGAPSIGIAKRNPDDPTSGATVVLRVADVDKARKELSQKGVKFEGDLEEIPGVVRIATFRDPSGNRLQLCQVLFDQKA